MTTRARILAVDDNEDTLEIIRTTLEDEYDVLTLSDPLDLTEMIDLFQPDLLILDIMMPRVTGFQLTEMLHRSKDTQEIPIILLSAKNSPRDIRHGYKMGASLYLTKPFMPDRLLKNVKTQFEVAPTTGRQKKLSLQDLKKQLMVQKGQRMGEVKLASSAIKDAGFATLEQIRAHKREHEKKHQG